MRICLITPEFPPHRYGGIGRYVHGLATGLFSRGHKVVVAGYQLHSERMIDHEWGRSVSVVWNGRFLWRFRKVGHLLSASLALRKWCKEVRNEFDIIEAPNWGGHGFLLPQLQCPLIVRLSTPHLDTLAHPPTFQDRVINKAETYLGRRAALIISNSRAMAEKAAMRYGVRQPNTVIPHGIEPGRTPAVTPNATVDLVFVGRAEHRKGMDLILLALDELLERESLLTMTFIGTNLDAYVKKEPRCVSILTRLRQTCPSRFRELGMVSELEKERILREADWSLMPSRFESFGIVAIEAMREGTPIIASLGSGIEEVAKFTPTTLFVSPGDGEDLVKAIKQAIRLGPHYKETVARSIREVFLSHFTAEAMVSATENVYMEVLRQVSHQGASSLKLSHGRYPSIPR